jgi:uncharacterized membrane protein
VLPGVGLFGASFDQPLYSLVGIRLREGAIPYRDFLLEYPPGSLVAFVVPALFESVRYDVAFKVTQAVFAAGCVACVGLVLRATGATPLRLFAATALAALAPFLLGSVALVRYDLWPAFAVAGALAALVHGHPRIGLGLLGVAAAAKFFALALLPIALLYLARRHGRRETITGAAIFTAVGIAFVLPFLLIAEDGLRYLVRWHLDRGLHLESVPAAGLAGLDALGIYDARAEYRSGAADLVGGLPDALATAQTLLLAFSVVGVALLFARSRRTARELGVAAAATVAVTLVFAKVLSPQFLLWLVPLVPLAVGPGTVVAWSAFAAALLLAHALYPSRWPELVALEPSAVAILVARNALLVVLAALLVRALVASTRVASGAGVDPAPAPSTPPRSAPPRDRPRADSRARDAV